MAVNNTAKTSIINGRYRKIRLSKRALSLEIYKASSRGYKYLNWCIIFLQLIVFFGYLREKLGTFMLILGRHRNWLSLFICPLEILTRP